MAGVHTICRGTNQLQNGLASKVDACQLDGQALIPGRPKYFFSVCHICTGLLANVGYCSSRKWVSFIWGKVAIA